MDMTDVDVSEADRWASEHARKNPKLVQIVHDLLVSMPISPARLCRLTQVASNVVKHAGSRSSRVLSETNLEFLASAMLDGVAAWRAQAMLNAVAVPPSRIPLWLVSGPDMLGAWIEWSGSGAAVASRLETGLIPGELSISGNIGLRSQGRLPTRLPPSRPQQS
jgi:hypothetical protein